MYQLVGFVRNQDAASGRGSFQSAGHIHRIADDGVLFAGANFAQQHRSGIDANAQAQRSEVARSLFVAWQLALHLADEVGERGAHGQGGANGVFGIVLAGDRHAKQAHHGVADVFIDHATMLGDGLIEPPPEQVDDVEHVGVGHRFGDAGEADDGGK